VPLTESSADSIIVSTPSASCPKPFNLACAVSIPIRRSKPFTRVMPPNADVAATAGVVIFLVN